MKQKLSKLLNLLCLDLCVEAQRRSSVREICAHVLLIQIRKKIREIDSERFVNLKVFSMSMKREHVVDGVQTTLEIRVVIVRDATVNKATEVREILIFPK